jgi:hypothetical protein
MEADITIDFEQTDFAGITARIINPDPSAFTILDLRIKPGFGGGGPAERSGMMSADDSRRRNRNDELAAPIRKLLQIVHDLFCKIPSQQKRIIRLMRQ